MRPNLTECLHTAWRDVEMKNLVLSRVMPRIPLQRWGINWLGSQADQLPRIGIPTGGGSDSRQVADDREVGSKWDSRRKRPAS